MKEIDLSHPARWMIRYLFIGLIPRGKVGYSGAWNRMVNSIAADDSYKEYISQGVFSNELEEVTPWSVAEDEWAYWPSFVYFIWKGNGIQAASKFFTKTFKNYVKKSLPWNSKTLSSIEKIFFNSPYYKNYGSKETYKSITN